MAGITLEQLAGKGTVVEQPIRVASAGDVAWDEQADVIVVGFGGAGGAAALEAHERGADVLVIERFEGGGATGNSGGVIYAGGGTRFQKDAGVEDSVENMFNYLKLECTDAVTPETLRRFCDESASNIDWLVGHGLQFEGSLYSGKTNYPPEDKYLYYAGNEKVPSFAAHAKPAARGHRAKGAGWTGYVITDALKAAADRLGIKFRTHTLANRLVIDAEGAVVGVEVITLEDSAARKEHQDLYAKVDPLRPFNGDRAEQAMADAFKLEQARGVRKLIRARGGIVLATGGFGYNQPMVSQHMPFLGENFRALMRLGSAGCSGSGIQLGHSVGGAVGKLDHSFLGRMIIPPRAPVEGIIINRNGQRFVNEDAYNAFLGSAILNQPGADAWIIMDKKLHREFLRQCIPNGDGSFRPYLAPALLNRFFGGTKKGKTLADLAGKIGVPAANLEAAVADFNGAIARGEADPMGKNPDYTRPVGEGPYRALNTSIGNKFSFCVFFTLGGLKVDELRGQVLRDDDTPIPGLYAAGRAAMGIPSNGYISGMSIADGIFSGRRAARDAALRRQDS